MITRFWAESATAVATMVFGLVIVKGALEFGIGWDSSGPQPGAFPFYTGLLVALASLGTLAITIGKRFAGSGGLQEISLDGEQFRRVAAFFLPLLGFVLLSVTLGMYVATILYLVFAMRFQGGYGWLPSLATAIGAAAFFYLALEKFFQIGLLKGPLEPLLGL
ncbi:tripartite tricarboxylate transporter TctB family protein [Bosea sp. BK604]|uniref:tripartite tricarboxylate transporter TctB family protein n=1 Tax=Bosea sp. BK604 TaxID=2512180 RepID=UPI0010E73D3E|nr:tripartite tricarboxylate transporter TctB family protein [Bosea sp. BK604]TCR59402.1 tripartite tricarboxylate transporter TctB family protein [Bosea sp. BK604]